MPANRLRLALAVLFLAPAGCIPNEPVGAWRLPYGFGSAANTGGATPGALVFGDSLIHGLVQQVSDEIVDVSGLSAVAYGSGGASLAHFAKASLLSQYPALLSVEEGVAFFQPRVTVLALITNDVRLLHAEQNVGGGYRLVDFEWALASTIGHATADGRCVVLVNMSEQVLPAVLPFAEDANAAMQAAADANPRAFLFDWEAHSANHPEWFIGGGNIHHTPEGEDAYVSFIATGVAVVHVFGGCTTP